MSNKVVVNINKVNVKIHHGQIFIINDEAYMLCCVDNTNRTGYECLYSLISLHDGNRWANPSTLDEIEKIISRDGFKHLGNVRITIENV